jgi:hypothetical protein
MSREENEKKFCIIPPFTRFTSCSTFPAAPFMSEFGEQEHLLVFSSSGNITHKLSGYLSVLCTAIKEFKHPDGLRKC